MTRSMPPVMLSGNNPDSPSAPSGFISYFKRYKMEIDLAELPPADPPPGFTWLAWCPALLHTHAEVLAASFAQEIDASVFASLGDLSGCRLLMTEMTRKSTFCPQATWLALCGNQPCATVQGLRERSGLGAIQNLGVLPEFRGMGLGRSLLLRALHGFAETGLRRGMLEVTAQNERAQQLYRRMGFRRVKTLYKAVALLS